MTEPTSGVNPVARDQFWELLRVHLSRRERRHHFYLDAFHERSGTLRSHLANAAGKVLAYDTPGALIKSQGKNSLEEAFIVSLKKRRLKQSWLNRLRPHQPRQRRRFRSEAVSVRVGCWLMRGVKCSKFAATQSAWHLRFSGQCY